MYNSVHDWSEVVKNEKLRKQMAKKIRRVARKEKNDTICTELNDTIRTELEELVKRYHQFLNKVFHKHRSHSENLDKQMNACNIVDHLCPLSQTVRQIESIENLSTKPVFPNGIYFTQAAKPCFSAQSLLGSSPL